MIPPHSPLRPRAVPTGSRRGPKCTQLLHTLCMAADRLLHIGTRRSCTERRCVSTAQSTQHRAQSNVWPCCRIPLTCIVRSLHPFPSSCRGGQLLGLCCGTTAHLRTAAMPACNGWGGISPLLQPFAAALCPLQPPLRPPSAIWVLSIPGSPAASCTAHPRSAPQSQPGAGRSTAAITIFYWGGQISVSSVTEPMKCVPCSL